MIIKIGSKGKIYTDWISKNNLKFKCYMCGEKIVGKKCK